MHRWPGVGDTARAVIPAAKVAYVDLDPVAVSHVRALLATGEGPWPWTPTRQTRRPDRAPGVPRLIDLAERVCLVFGLTLNIFPAPRAREVIAEYADLNAPGSCIVVSCGRADDAGLWERLSGAFTAAPPSTITQGRGPPGFP
jgi:hypothetical protein